jgi:sarcosine oxidase gamma subunit
MRRLTALDLDSLPAVGAILRETPAVIQRLDAERFRIFVPQELARSVAEAMLDLAEGLA